MVAEVTAPDPWRFRAQDQAQQHCGDFHPPMAFNKMLQLRVDGLVLYVFHEVTSVKDGSDNDICGNKSTRKNDPNVGQALKCQK